MNRLKVICIIIAMFTTVSLNAQKTEKWSDVTIQTNGTCQACKDKIEKGIAYEKGVKDVDYDLATSKVKITFDAKKTSTDDLRAAIVKLGFKVDTPPDTQAKSCSKTCTKPCGSKQETKPACSGNHDHGDHNHHH